MKSEIGVVDRPLQFALAALKSGETACITNLETKDMATATKKTGKQKNTGSKETASKANSRPGAFLQHAFEEKGLMQNPFMALLFGAILGLSAPGLEQWYLAWFALAPLFLMIYASQSLIRQWLLGLCFGLGYNLVYLHWYLNLAPLDWMGFPGLAGTGLSVLAWLIVSFHQALIISIFSVVAARLPICAGFTFKRADQKQGGKWMIPALSVIPLVWVLIVNKIGNSPDFLGVPWSMLEYTQYRQGMLIQGASVFGGIGLSYVLVAANLAFACLFAAFTEIPALKRLFAENKDSAFYYCLGTALLMGAYVAPGLVQGSNINLKPEHNVAILEGAINIDMQKTSHRYSLTEIMERYDLLFKTAGTDNLHGLTVLPEGALPAYLNECPEVLNWLKKSAVEHKTDIVVGAMDRQSLDHPYNAAFGVSSSGLKCQEAYHKRYLVPLGEYTPLFVKYLPEWVRRWTNTPSGSGFAAGKQPALLPLNLARVGPLICFESISPELTAATCREGAELLVNISDLAWFHKSNCGKQMLAFAVFRAVENRRYFVFAANTGPSALIDARGTIAEYGQQDESKVVCGKVGLNSSITPFALWYR